MAPKKKKTKKKKKKQSCDRHSETLDWPPASDPNPTTTSPSTSATTGGGATSSIPPSSALTSAPTTTATEPFLPLATLPPSLLPTFVRPLAHSILGTHQECFSGTSDQATTTADPAGPSTAPSASAATTSTEPVLPITEDFLSLFIPTIMASLKAFTKARKGGPERLKQMNKIVRLLASQLGPMESVLETFWALAEIKEGAEKELKVASDALDNMEGLKEAVEVVAKLLAEKRKGAESSDSCRGSKREGGDPDSGSGGGDGEGGGVCV